MKTNICDICKEETQEPIKNSIMGFIPTCTCLDCIEMLDKLDMMDFKSDWN